jgi:DNA-binding response OmpR family regulator
MTADPFASSAIGTSGARGHVLVVDDEVALARLVSSYLVHGGFDVTQAFDGPSALDTARRIDPDLVVLDLGLPGLDGRQVCRELRYFTDCYVIMLTARTEERDKLEGLSIGADDYLTKPFSPRELVARAQAMLRRPRTRQAHVIGRRLTFGAMVLDLDGREVRVAGEPVEVTPTEFALLAVLGARPAQALSRRDLIEAVWGANWVGDEHLVDVHVRNLRRRLGDDASEPKFIRTVRGVGYRMGKGG